MIKKKGIRLENNKGITLIALVVTIIVLIILASVSIKIILGDNGIVEKSKQAKIMQEIAAIQEKLELLKAPIQIEKYSVNLENYLEKLEEVKDKYGVDSIEKKNEINAEILVNGKYMFLIKDKENGDVEIIYLGKAGELLLSATSGTYTYPTSGTFEIAKNATGGELSVKSENENIAKATISGNVVTVIPQNMTGVTKIIVTSAANGQYSEGKAVHTATVKGETIETGIDNWKVWATKAGLDYKKYNDIHELLLDSDALSTLANSTDAVDYMMESDDSYHHIRENVFKEKVDSTGTTISGDYPLVDILKVSYAKNSVLDNDTWRQMILNDTTLISKIVENNLATKVTTSNSKTTTTDGTTVTVSAGFKFQEGDLALTMSANQSFNTGGGASNRSVKVTVKETEDAKATTIISTSSTEYSTSVLYTKGTGYNKYSNMYSASASATGTISWNGGTTTNNIMKVSGTANVLRKDTI